MLDKFKYSPKETTNDNILLAFRKIKFQRMYQEGHISSKKQRYRNNRQCTVSIDK